MGKSIAFPPSHCSSCQHSLSAMDLIPVISYISLKGKCRYCSEKISVQYPIVELITGFLFMAVYDRYGISFVGIAVVIFVSILVVTAMIDYKFMIIPNKINFIIMILGIINFLFGNNHSFVEVILGSLIGGGSLYIMGLVAGWLLRKEAMGGGDIKLMGACGLSLGINGSIFALLFAFYSAAALILILLVLRKLKKNRYIPFGPFLATGAILAILFH